MAAFFQPVDAHASPGISTLRAEVAGEIILPGDTHYERHRRVWNADFDRRPAMIVRAVRLQDVVAALAYARSTGLEVTVRGGGHSFCGQSVADGALMIDLRRMSQIMVNPNTRRARVQGGATWGEVDKVTQVHGLAVTGGQVSHTGVAGLTLGGGLGYAMRAYGLTIDHLLSAEVVTADGRVVRASADENEDLFFGLRGGGGNFGIVTEFEFRLNPLGPTVLGGHLGWSREQGPEFLLKYMEFLKTCPDELMTTLIYLNMPPLPFIPPALRKKPGWIVSVCGIDIAKAEAALTMLRGCGPPRFDVVQPMPYLAVQSFLDKAEPFGTRLYGKSHFFNEITEELLLTLHEQFADLPSPETKVFSLQMGGAVKRIRDEEMAFTGREAAMAMMFGSEWKNDGDKERCIAWVRRVWRATEKFSRGTYNNFSRHLDEETLKTMHGADKYRKLQLLKTKYDPQNVFHWNHNIKPLAAASAAVTKTAEPSSVAAMMRIAHVVIAAFDVAESAAFYQEVFGFTDLGESTRTRSGRTLLCRDPDGREQLEIDLVKTDEYWRLPNAYHFAVETDAVSFENIYATLKKRGAKVLSAPPPEADSKGFGEWVARGVKYRRYLFVDANLVYLEVLNRLPTPWTRETRKNTASLRVNHLVIAARDVRDSVDFYANVFGFKDCGENPHAEGARTMVHFSKDGHETLEVVVQPYDAWLLPNPAGFSLEVDAETFETIRVCAAECNPESPPTACVELEVRGVIYKSFSVLDPSGSRVEVLTLEPDEPTTL
jgi:catechol 2,3-dioxygenase-like lactoylglutathione lyase family enzyme